MQPHELTAAAAAALIKAKKLSCEELTRSCLARIEARDPAVRAWSYLDPQRAIRHARELDKCPAKGPLHGIPFGVKDMIDTGDMPTTHNSPLYFGHEPAKDAACVAVARHSGALILGKTDTVEFASGGRKALTRNPYNLAYTPGGSSSGSGAAVGDWQVPLAFGTQTGGSHIRPASFNGIYAIKPTHGVVSREGVKNYSYTLDTVGWFGRSVADLQLVGGAFRLSGIDTAATVAPKGLKIGLCRSPMWDRSEPDGRMALDVAARRLADAGCQVFDLELAEPFERMTEAQDIIMHAEGKAAFLPDYLAFGDRLHADFRDKVENAKGITPERALAAYDLAASCRPAFDALFGPDLDAILTLAAPGEAPEGLHTTGDWVFNSMWTLLHVPCVAIPVGLGALGLPVGIQIVGPRMADAQLMRIAEAIAPAIDVKGPMAAAERPLALVG